MILEYDWILNMIVLHMERGLLRLLKLAWLVRACCRLVKVHQTISHALYLVFISMHLPLELVDLHLQFDHLVLQYRLSNCVARVHAPREETVVLELRIVFPCTDSSLQHSSLTECQFLDEVVQLPNLPKHGITSVLLVDLHLRSLF